MSTLMIWIADGLMLLSWIAAIRLIAWRPESSVNSVLAGGTSKRRPFPQKWHYAVLAISSTLLVVYGSLVPLRYSPLSFADAVSRFGSIPYLDLSLFERADWVANILLAVPVSFFSMGVFALDEKRFVIKFWSAPFVIVASASIGVGLEFIQLWFPNRTVSQNDIIAFCLGSLAGSAIWLALGQTFSNWIRCFMQARTLADRLKWLLDALIIGLLLYSVLPLDMVVSGEEMGKKFYAGKIQLVPFQNFRWDFESITGLLRDFAAFIVVGLWGATWRLDRNSLSRGAAESGLIGGCLAFAIEIAQMLVYSRHSSTQDVLIGFAAASLGGWFVRLLSRSNSLGANWVQESWGKSFLSFSIAIVYGIFLGVFLCFPLEPLTDPNLIRERFNRFLSVPFASLYVGSEFNAVTEVLRKILLFAPFASLLTLAVEFSKSSLNAKRALLGMSFAISVGVSFLIEFLQVYFPPRISDITDVIIGSMGAAIGIFVTHRAMMALSAAVPPLRTCADPVASKLRERNRTVET